MKENISLKQLDRELEFFQKIYDSVRLVDPVQKKVLDYRGSSIHCTNEICYNYWGNGKICENCISIRAHMENKSFMKLEKKDKKILMVTAIPIEHGNRPLVLELLKDATDSMFVGSGDYNTNETLESLVRKMNDMVIKDSVTNLYNRRFADERLPVDIVNAISKKQPLSLCYADIDNFKNLNDSYGHKVGDTAIKEVSNAITKCIRPKLDWAARYGGDEFLLCFNNTDEKQAAAIMERIKNAIEKIPSSLEIADTQISISYGIKTLNDTFYTADEFIHLADQEMYKQKKSKSK